MLIGEPDALPTLELGRNGFLAARAEPEKQRILPQQSALDVVLLDGVDDAVDAPARRLPDFRGGLGAVAANQLMQFELAVGSEKAGAATRGTAADDVLLDQHDAQALAQEFRGRTDAAESPADDQHVALDRLGEWRAILVLP